VTINDDDDGGYAVGYGKPPKHFQFTKGKSGNPTGRRRGSRNFSTLLHDELNVKIPVTENGKRRKITKQEAMVKQLTNKGASGDLKAIPIVVNEIRSREDLAGAAQTEVVRQEDELVMGSIIKRIIGAAAPPADAGALADPPIDTAPERGPKIKSDPQ
jgi:Family of unknown function (DUF5681)